MPKKRRPPQMSMPEPQVCKAPQQPAFQGFSNAEMCEMLKQSVPATTPGAKQPQDGYSPAGTGPTVLNLTDTVPKVKTGLINEHNTAFNKKHTPTVHGSKMRHNKTGQFRTDELKDVPDRGPGTKTLNAVNTGMGLYSLHKNAKCTANDELGWEDRYQCGVGATADIVGLAPVLPAQILALAVGLQQYGAGDINEQTDTIAEQGHDVRKGLLDLLGDNPAGQGISEVGGVLTVIGSSFVHGAGNFGNAGYKIAESTIGAAGDVVGLGLKSAQPASIEEAVARANSGCTTHASNKAGLYLDRMGLDRQGQIKSMNGFDFDQGANRDLFGKPTGWVGGNTQQENAELDDEQKDMLLKYLMSEPSKSSNNPPQ